MSVHSRIPALDGIRGLAILMVMTSHFLVVDQMVPELELESNRIWLFLKSGFLGVDLFFVLSGFLITSILINNRKESHYFKHFYIRRILRIFPLYYLVLLILWGTVIWIDRAPERLSGYDSISWFVFYVSNFAMILKGDWTYQSYYLGIDHFWSLAIEEQFYLVWPFLVYWVPIKKLKRILYGLILMALLSRILGEIWLDNFFFSYMHTLSRVDALAIGALMAIHFRENPDSIQDIKIPRIWIVVSFLGVGSYLFVGGWWEKGTVMALFFVGLILLSLQKEQGKIRRIMESTMMVEMGKLSYGMYIIHQLIKPLFFLAFGLKLFELFHWITAQILYGLIAFVITYGLAKISWVTFEYPILSLKKKWASKPIITPR